jgi:hypothetical protein
VSVSLIERRGRSSIVLVAPHAGRRDAGRRPWGHEPLKMNDLHTGSLALELAERLDASAIVNDGTDRNDVDLGRIGAAHAHAPHFLVALGEALERVLAGHPRATLLAVHGWNVVQPAVDVGLGARPVAEPFGAPAGGAVSPDFATSVLRRFMAALEVHGIAATPGLRYPARAAQNLLQLFTGRHREDARPLVRRVTALAPRVDAVQLELSLPLRIPGPWRDAFVRACGALHEPEGHDAVAWLPPAAPATAATLELVAGDFAGLAAIDETGGRLLLFPADGSLVTFTAERIGAHGADRVAGLRITSTADGVALDYDGPMLRFADTTPFLDLEHGLAGASVLAARVRLRLVRSHDADPACGFGHVDGRVELDGAAHAVRGSGRRSHGPRRLGERARASLHGPDGALAIDGDAGVVCRDGRHAAVALATVALDDGRVRIRGDVGGAPLAVDADVLRRLPVVRGGPAPGRLLLVACRTETGAAGWAELPGA